MLPESGRDERVSLQSCFLSAEQSCFPSPQDDVATSCLLALTPRRCHRRCRSSLRPPRAFARLPDFDYVFRLFRLSLGWGACLCASAVYLVYSLSNLEVFGCEEDELKPKGQDKNQITASRHGKQHLDSR